MSIGGRDNVAVSRNRRWRKRDPIDAIVLCRMAVLVNAVRSWAFYGGTGREDRAIGYSLVKRPRLKSDLLPHPWAFVIRKSLEETLPDPIQDALFAFHGSDSRDSVLFPVT